MAKPPAGSSLLFGALAVSGRIKQRKNGSYRMVLKGIDEIDWFTDRPNRAAGEWSPKQLVKEWDVLFSDGAGTPNAQATFEAASKRKLVTFEMFKPKLSDSNQILSFKVRGIGKKNKDLLTGLRNKRLSDTSLFIDDATTPCLRTVTLRLSSSSGLPVTMRSLSSNANFGEATDVNGNANLSQINPYTFFTAGGGMPGLPGGGLFGGSTENPKNEAIIEIPVTLTMGIKSSQLKIKRSSGRRGFAPFPLTCTGNPLAAEFSYSLDGVESGTIEVPCVNYDGISPTINWG